MLKIYVEKLEQDVRCDAYAPGATSFPALSLSHSLPFFLQKIVAYELIGIHFFYVFFAFPQGPVPKLNILLILDMESLLSFVLPVSTRPVYSDQIFLCVSAA
jgi:hypothetical protein